MVGVTLGVLMGRFKAVDDLFGIWVNIFVSAPLSALVPVLMILFGIGETTVVVTVFLFAVWIIVLDTRAGIQHVPNSLIEMGRSLRRLDLRPLQQDRSPCGTAGDPRRDPARPCPRRKGRGDRPASGVHHRIWRTVRTLLAQLRHGEFWALTIILFAAAMLMSAAIEHIEKKVDYYAGVR